jgi:hypothetical protein
MTHDKRGYAPAGASVESMNVAAADATGPDPDQDIVRTDLRLRHLDHFKLQVILEQEGSHMGIRNSVLPVISLLE